jgi:hypothetical protein
MPSRRAGAAGPSVGRVSIGAPRALAASNLLRTSRAIGELSPSRQLPVDLDASRPSATRIQPFVLLPAVARQTRQRRMLARPRREAGLRVQEAGVLSDTLRRVDGAGPAQRAIAIAHDPTRPAGSVALPVDLARDTIRSVANFERSPGVPRADRSGALAAQALELSAFG